MKKLYAILMLLAAGPAGASMVTLTTPTNATTSGGAVNASATITTGADTVTVLLTNLEGNPLDVSQTISDFSFTLSNGFTAVNTTSTPTASLVCVPATPCTTTVKPWQLTSTGNTVLLEGLFGEKGIAPSQEIIGPGPYTNANASINGNGPHNPFINQTASFTFALTGVTASTTVTGGVFSFGTQPEFVTAAGGSGGGGGGGGGQTPEPQSLVLAFTGALLLVGARWLSRKPAPAEAAR